MIQKTIISKPLPHMPWLDRPKDSSEIIWRYDKNPVIGRKPLKDASRIFNSAIIPYQNEFIGVFRADHINGYPNLHLSRSKDGIHWQIEEEIIKFHNEDGSPAKPILYAYDPHLLEMDSTYYITW